MTGLRDRMILTIKSHGWFVIMVLGDEEGPGFAYSVGLYQTFEHPEVIVLGLPSDLMHHMINNVGEEVRRGRRLGPGDESDGVLEDCPVRFMAVSRSHYAEFFGQALDYYGVSSFPAIQCYWPDRHRRFPWQSGVDGECSNRQPSLQGTSPAGKPFG